MKVELCSGRYCQGAGAQELAKALAEQGIPFEQTECRSLCPHAPVMFVDRRARLKVAVEDVVKLKR